MQFRPSLRAAVVAVASFGALAAGASSGAFAGTLTIDATTTQAGGNYAPRNVLAVWVEDSAGVFIKTIDRWAESRRQYLLNWRAAAGNNDVDAISGATRVDHGSALRITWDLKNRQGIEIPDGTYRVRMELADRNSTAAAQNNQGTFTFVKTPAGSSQTASNGGFNDVTISYSAAAPVCSDGKVDAGETCDPPGSCPTSCTASADACAPNVLVGAASSCTAACVVRTVSECVAGDGCCPGSCTAATDSDCAGDGGDDTSGGCQVGGSAGASLWLLALGLGLLASRRRRT